jgi:O-antigen/teichoic acid export membrane protein
MLYRLKKNINSSTLLAQRYFVLGIALQSGTRYLISPLIIHYFGSIVYAEYALFYSIVQIIALLTSVGMTSGLMVFWYQYKNKQKFVGSLLLLLGCIGGAISIILGSVLYFYSPFIVNDLSQLSLVGFSISFAMIRNISIIGFAVLRIRSLQKSYFFANLFGTILIVLLLIIGGRYFGGGLPLLIMINIGCWAFLTVFAFSRSKLKSLSYYAKKRFFAFSRRIFRFSIPLFVYAFLMLSTQTFNKWLVKAYFDKDVFTQYIIDFEAALAVLILTLIISTYNFPIVTKLINKKDWTGLWKNSLEHYALIIGGSFFISLSYYFYATIGGVYLSSNYWILALAFMLSNIFSINSTLIQAQARSLWLVFFIGPMVVFLWACFILISQLNNIQWLCWLYVGYYTIIAIVSALHIKSIINLNLIKGT